jgi:hypothetical protein
MRLEWEPGSICLRIAVKHLRFELGFKNVVPLKDHNPLLSTAQVVLNDFGVFRDVVLLLFFFFYDDDVGKRKVIFLS